ncbi:MAG: DNA/RNA non-specific endonuclease [Pseudomonas sp.]|nr:DNA/RNA non-specific endonuclease [Pseudomonas sp.]
MQKIILAALVFAPTVAQAQFSQCLDNFPGKKLPALVDVVQPKQMLRELCFDGFAVLHSGESKTALYVVEKLNRARIVDAGDEERTDRFYPEARLPSRERAQLEDYRGSGYDRGHLAPAADMPNPNSMAQSFSLANMVPQAPDHNRGIWAKNIEKPVRQYAMRAAGDVFVFTGPVFKDKPAKAIGAGKVWVPTHLYKLVFDQQTGKSWAYWTENTDNARMSQPISYQELVARTGIEFLPDSSGSSASANPVGGSADVSATDTPTCYTGPRGGTYTISPSGKKNYDGC